MIRKAPPVFDTSETPVHGKVYELRSDSWVNALSGFNDSNRDPRLSSVPQVVPVSDADAETLWRSNDMGRKAVNTEPDQMFREGYEILIDEDKDESTDGTTDADESSGKDDAEAMDKWIREVDLNDKANLAWKYKRAYGGGALLLGIDDGQTDLTQPLDEKNIKTFTHVTALERRLLYPFAWYANPLAAKFGEPMLYRLVPHALPTAVTTYGQMSIGGGTQLPNGINTNNGMGLAGTAQYPIIHESRLIVFRPEQTSIRAMLESQGWGDSCFVAIQAVLRDFNMSWDATALLLKDFSQAVLGIKGLAELIDTDGSAAVQARAQAIDMCRSVCRMVLIDADGETFDRKPTPMGGLPEVLEKFMVRLAAAMDMPVTLLMGMSPAGLNATGASDIRGYYDTIAALQGNKLRKPLERAIKLKFLSKDGPTKGIEPDNWSINFNPLWQLTQAEKIKMRLDQANIDHLYITDGVLSAEEVAVNRFGGDEWSDETHIDLKMREKLANQTPEIDPATGQPIAVKMPGALPETPAPIPVAPAPGEPAAGGGTPRPFGEDESDEIDLQEKIDGSEDQPRDEGGKWTVGGRNTSNETNQWARAKAKEQNRPVYIDLSKATVHPVTGEKKPVLSYKKPAGDHYKVLPSGEMQPNSNPHAYDRPKGGK